MANIPIVIVSYRNISDVEECLFALQRMAAVPAFDVYICENGGCDAFGALIPALIQADGPCIEAPASREFWEQGPDFVRVRHLAMRDRDAGVSIAAARENLGYAGGINAWLRLLMADHSWPGAWILNPDTKPEPAALAALVNWSAVRGKGMVGSRIVSFAEPDKVHTRGLRWSALRASTRAVGHREPADIAPDPDLVERLLDSPSGSSIYVTRPALDAIGLMDESYFLFYEDLEWGLRAKAVCGVGYAHDSVVPHHGGTTIGNSRGRTKASAFSVYLEFRNRIHLVRRWRPLTLPWALSVLCARAFEYAMVGAAINMWVALAGLHAALCGELGRPDRLFDFRAERPSLRRKGAHLVKPEFSGPR
jgi:N-acetylglucosaminyl-diphospho-decaprenol L-rhamnosyltransferase